MITEHNRHAHKFVFCRNCLKYDDFMIKHGNDKNQQHTQNSSENKIQMKIKTNQDNRYIQQ